ncbi:MAG: hypothetical protein HYX66_10270 [Ignavibacteria bacterium]|nr:hypothetical protein [Ignavibacteria bacterium]
MIYFYTTTSEVEEVMFGDMLIAVFTTQQESLEKAQSEALLSDNEQYVCTLRIVQSA